MKCLAIDVGTSFVKVALLDASSPATRLVGNIERAAYELDHPTPEAAELPLDRLWAAITTAVRAVTLAPGFAPNEVTGIGFSCMMPTLVLLDREHEPLTPVITHLDRRARILAGHAWSEIGSEFHATNGNLPLPGGISALSYRAWRMREPKRSARVAHYLHLNSWLGLRLTGQRAIDAANAAFSGLYDTFATKTWSRRWCDYFEVDPQWLPALVSGDATIGTLRSEIATAWGLAEGTPVKIGTADTSSALLADEVKRGEVLHVAGTTQVLAALVDSPRPGEKRLVRPLGVGNSFVHVTHNPLGGAALEWLRVLAFSDVPREEFYGPMVDQALNHPTEVILDPPYLGGDRLEMEAKEAGFRRLTLSTKRIDLLAAVLVAMRAGHDKAVAELGVAPNFSRIHLTGGAAEVVRRLLPGYESNRVTLFDEGSLLGVARLFSRL